MAKSTNAKFMLPLLLPIFFALFFCLSGCGGSKGTETITTPPPTTPTTPTAASIILSALPTTVKSDNSNFTTITVTALSAAHAVVPGVTVTMGTDTGTLGVGTVVTDSTGTATLSFSAGPDPINRTATITATAGTVSAQIPVQIVGSTITLATTGPILPDNGTSPVTLTVTAFSDTLHVNPVAGAAVVLTPSGAGNVSFTPAAGVTNASGIFTSSVAGTAAGNVTVTASALGVTATLGLTVSATALTFAIDQQTLNGTIIANNTTTAMKTNTDSLAIRVNAPSSANVVFATTIGVWDGTTFSVVSKAVVAGKATATLTTTQAGVASVQVYDQAVPTTNDTLTVAMTSAAAAYRITLQASPTVVPLSLGTTTGSSTLIATVLDASSVPIGDAPVAFSIINPTGGGETVSPVVVLTAATPTPGLGLGQARASFTSGSLPSGAGGVQIRASVVGTAVQTEPVGVDLTPSGNDAAIVIGGTAGSIAFGMATVLGESSNKSQYILAMSALVADVNGNPVAGTLVSLSAWPVAWSTRTFPTPFCSIDPDTATTGTFVNEDLNENVFLDTGEDGYRAYYAPPHTAVVGGTKDGQLTPSNSDGGTVPATATTDASGLANFNLTYPKQSAIWTITRIRASTIVQGSETRGQIIFRLPALDADVSPCKLESPYHF